MTKDTRLHNEVTGIFIRKKPLQEISQFCIVLWM